MFIYLKIGNKFDSENKLSIQQKCLIKKYFCQNFSQYHYRF